MIFLLLNVDIISLLSRRLRPLLPRPLSMCTGSTATVDHDYTLGAAAATTSRQRQ